MEEWGGLFDSDYTVFASAAIALIAGWAATSARREGLVPCCVR